VGPFRGLDELRENAPGRPRVKERHAAVADSPPWLLVDQPQAVGAAAFELLFHVGASIGRVVKTRPALREEPPDRRLLPERTEQLDVRVAHPEERSLDALLLDRLAVLKRHPKALGVELDRRVEILDGDTDMVDCLEHGEAV
jgi:hypothetical protein